MSTTPAKHGYTVINHNFRLKLGLTLEEYVVMDTIHQHLKKNPTAISTADIIDTLKIKYELFLKVMNVLKEKKLVISDYPNVPIISKVWEVAYKNVPKKLLPFQADPEDLDMVIDYFKEEKIRDATKNAELFYNHYESVGWKRGKSKIVNWRACVKTWSFDKEGEKNNGLEKGKVYPGAF